MRVLLDTVINDVDDKPIMVDEKTEATCKFFLLKAIDTPRESDGKMGYEEKCKLYDLLKKIKKADKDIVLKPEEAKQLKERMSIFSVSVVGAVCELLDGNN